MDMGETDRRTDGQQLRLTSPQFDEEAVVKVRGNTGERRFWAPKIVGERSQAHTAVNGASRLTEAFSAYSRASNFFQSSWAPKFILKPLRGGK